MRPNQYRAMIEGRTDTMWVRYKDSDSADLLAAIRRNQARDRYLVAGDLAAIRAELEPGKTVRDLGKAGLRRILDARFEYVVSENRARMGRV
jgi:hypothetical protein